tara:strand:+ start:4267 stop:4893 length:627 start_codon:yes stop_codon:yes gene_type:complete
MNSNDHLNQIYRSSNILDEKILGVIRKIKRQNFVPEAYKSFAYSDITMPLGFGISMLTPSCEATILQEMDFHENDNVLLIGNGSGHLTECVSHLTSSVTAYECNNTLYDFGKTNLDNHSVNREKIYLFNKNIFDFLDKINDHSKVIFTCSLRSYDFFINYLSENTRTFTFLSQDKSPYCSGIIIDKTRNSYTVSKNIVTSQTDSIVGI